MEIIFPTGAKEDIKESAEYYENEVSGLGKAFLEIVELLIEKILAFPNASCEILKPYRRYLIKRFPFGIIYRIEKEYIFVATVMRLKRKPYYWLDDSKYK
jgi:toxin ParE1/3/4